MKWRGLSWGAGVAAAAVLAISSASAETVLRIGMTAADVPLTAGQPDQGGEGYRFVGYQFYDALVNWDLTSADKVAPMRPGLATEWAPDPNDQKTWIFKLREGVKFHDGTPWNADAAIWNFDKIFKKDAPQYDARQVAQVLNRVPSVASYRKIDDMTIAVTTKYVNSIFPFEMTAILYSSPTQWEKVGRDWVAFAAKPAGTGPFKLDRLVPRERAEGSRNTGYWDPQRIPKVDRLLLIPMPEASARTAALLAGQIDWNEAPAPDALPRLRQAGMQIILNKYPHNWTYMPLVTPGSPWADVRVRHAANLAIDREGLVKLLGGTATPEVGLVYPGHQWFGNPTFKVRYDPAEAKRLLKEAGYGPDKPVKVKIAISTSGSGQMQPLPMNEFVQENLREVGIDADFEVMEWMALLGISRIPGNAPEMVRRGITAINVSRSFPDPYFGFHRMVHARFVPPTGANWGMIDDPFVNSRLDEVYTTFDVKKQDALLAQVHEKLVNESYLIWIVHDLNPRALSPKVKNFVQAQSWNQDLTPIEIK